LGGGELSIKIYAFRERKKEKESKRRRKPLLLPREGRGKKKNCGAGTDPAVGKKAEDRKERAEKKGGEMNRSRFYEKGGGKKRKTAAPASLAKKNLGRGRERIFLFLHGKEKGDLS